jgi:hypothetical protein
MYYSIEVTVAAPPPTGPLSNLVFSSGTLSPAFTSGGFNYSVSVSNATTSITVTPTAAVNTSTITVNGSSVLSGNPSSPLSLSVGDNFVGVEVTNGGQTWWYYTYVTRRTPYQEWATNAGFGATGLDPMGDFNGSGLKNLLKWGFDTGVTSNVAGAIQVSGNAITAHGTPILLAQPDGAGGINYFALFGERLDAAANGLSYVVEFSGDLLTWSPSSAVPTVVAQDGVIQAVTVPFPVLADGLPARFFHVKVNSQ